LQVGILEAVFGHDLDEIRALDVERGSVLDQLSLRVLGCLLAVPVRARSLLAIAASRLPSLHAIRAKVIGIVAGLDAEGLAQSILVGAGGGLVDRYVAAIQAFTQGCQNPAIRLKFTSLICGCRQVVRQ
jgi:hypothetical protein